jgi:hypothetical protein
MVYFVALLCNDVCIRKDAKNKDFDGDVACRYLKKTPVVDHSQNQKYFLYDYYYDLFYTIHPS